jgi:RNase H-fold protein (predicted Holliday junction resolvase)
VIGRIVDLSDEVGVCSLERKGDGEHPMFAGSDVFVDDVLGVGVEAADAGEWFIGVAAMEFVRSGALYHEIHDAFDRRVGSVSGVEKVWSEDTETWIVVGSPNPVELLTAAAEVIDEFGPRIIDHLAPSDQGAEPASVPHAIEVFDDRWHCSCGARGNGNWAEVVRAARHHDKATKTGRS